MLSGVWSTTVHGCIREYAFIAPMLYLLRQSPLLFKPSYHPLHHQIKLNHPIHPQQPLLEWLAGSLWLDHDMLGLQLCSQLATIAAHGSLNVCQLSMEGLVEWVLPGVLPAAWRASGVVSYAGISDQCGGSR